MVLGFSRVTSHPAAQAWKKPQAPPLLSHRAYDQCCHSTCQLRPPLAVPQRLAPPAACSQMNHSTPHSSSPCSGPPLLLGLLPPSGRFPAPTSRPCDPNLRLISGPPDLGFEPSVPCQVGTQLSVLTCLRKDLYLGSALKLTASLSPVAGHRWPGPVTVTGDAAWLRPPTQTFGNVSLLVFSF